MTKPKKPIVKLDNSVYFIVKEKTEAGKRIEFMYMMFETPEGFKPAAVHINSVDYDLIASFCN